MQTNPFARRKRLRLVTASLGAAAALGGGTLAWSPATDSSTTTEETATSTASDDRFAAPVQAPATSSGSVHA